ncbi:SHOCT domain-containing protein [Chitinophaga sp. LS1]|uniref:SHOCT domain-containing protein n=1 Tax=Chitinophaga sp. LS1 TaxID=3051176 RepID=UPI002AABF2C3|nr:SHOCT domain-containing protein [Chitinophaga sp. LS1]WPV66325.1 SHOCT domain-containing protein [Chitinophaga sp. LS1]
MKLFLLLFICYPFFVSAQNDTIYPYGNRTTGILHMSQYDWFKEGGKLKLGTGSAPSGDFQFIYHTLGKLPLHGQDSNKIVKISTIKAQGTPKKGLRWFMVINGEGLEDYIVEVANALGSGEIASNDPSIIKKLQTANKPFSIADEIKKFKDLLDQGVITQEEFDQQKKKLLNQ